MDVQDKKMFDVDLKCAKCGAHITQLPFQPSGDRPVFCRECNQAHRAEMQGGQAQKQMFDVDVTCAGCGKKITQLPFIPKGDGDINCKECYIKSKNPV